MKITQLHAENVHGYLPLEINFFDDLTFLTGLNGSGKTSALRLIMALLTPNIHELGAMVFSYAAVTAFDGEREIKISAQKGVDGLILEISSIDEKLKVSKGELELLTESKRDEPRSQIREAFQSNNVFQQIAKLSTPMFLGLDRRFFVPGMISEEFDDVRRREYMARRYWPEDLSSRNSAVSASLIEVNYLVVSRMQEIRAAQEDLDEKLRREFFTKAFEYKPSDFLAKGPKMPSRAELDKYRQQLTKIEHAAEGDKIPVPEIRQALTQFFERMNKVIDSLEKNSAVKKKKGEPKRPPDKSKENLFFGSEDYVEWIINRPQADRIINHLELLTEYIESRKSLRDPINRFRQLVNDFLSQTNKEVQVAANGQVTVSVNGSDDQRPISALSSGERQLLVMLAHLSLNPNLVGSGIFIVDEPELSLHIDWQEKFVDAIRSANPNVQMILATHSPAIILDRTEACCSLS